MALVAAAILWPVVLSAAAVARDRLPFAASAVYLAAAQVCHQQSARSLHFRGFPLPVCARCTGLYLAAPIGAFVAWRRRPRHRGDPGDRRHAADRALSWLLVAAATPTLLTLILEWGLRVDPGNLIRLIAALPAGAVLAYALVVIVSGADVIQ